MRVASPDSRCIEVEGVTGLRYGTEGGFYDMHPADAKALVAEGGFIPSMTGVTSIRIGFCCTKCGFRCWFKRCSRCGGEAVKEVR